MRRLQDSPEPVVVAHQGYQWEKEKAEVHDRSQTLGQSKLTVLRPQLTNKLLFQTYDFETETSAGTEVEAAKVNELLLSPGSFIFGDFLTGNLSSGFR